MATTALRELVASERRRQILVTLLLAGGLAATYTQALVQRAYLTGLDYAVAFAICLIAGALIVDVARALLCYLVAMALAVIMTLALLTLPLTLGELPSPGNVVVTTLWITIVFNSVFPFPLLGLLVATLVGAFIGEQYF